MSQPPTHLEPAMYAQCYHRTEAVAESCAAAKRRHAERQGNHSTVFAVTPWRDKTMPFAVQSNV